MSFSKAVFAQIEVQVESVFEGVSPDEFNGWKRKDSQVFGSQTALILLALLLSVGGLTMGSYAATTGHRGWFEQSEQMIYSALKLPILVLATTAISLPSFFVLNTIAGLRNDFQYSMWAIWSSLSAFAIIHISLLPFLIVFYLSLHQTSDSYRLAVLFNALLMGTASIGSQLVLLRSYRKLIIRDKNHFWILIAWSIIFAFVGIQLAWTLRPFIGSPQIAPTFLREEAFGNAYLEVWEIIRRGIFSYK